MAMIDPTTFSMQSLLLQLIEKLLERLPQHLDDERVDVTKYVGRFSIGQPQLSGMEPPKRSP